MDNMVKPGLYTLQCEASARYLDTRREDLGDGLYQNRLLLQETASAKWEVVRVGDGYMIKLADSELYCAVANAGEFEGKAVVLSTVPTIWTFSYIDADANTVAIFWSASLSNIVWQENPDDEERSVRISRMGTETPLQSATWRMCPVEPNLLDSTRLIPGIYALQNKASKTFLTLSPDETTIGCWPKADLKKGIPKWEIAPFGDGYTIKMYGTKRYCTLKNGTSDGSPVSTSTFPSTWRIEPTMSPIHGEGNHCQIYWSDTGMVWDLHEGSSNPGTPVYMRCNDRYHVNRIFQLIP